MKQFMIFAAVFLSLLCSSVGANAVPYAAIVVDARTGEVLHRRNADTRLHPAGLTKLMTLYIAFYMIEAGELDLDQKATFTRNAAAEPPVELGLWPDAQIKVRYLIRATGVQGANDAATALGETIAGSEAAFARLANQFAKELGMENTTFKNAHGLTESGHLSTARDMARLTLALRRDFPEYWNLLGRPTADAGIKTVNHSGRRLLEAYEGVEAVKTGYTRAAGFTGMALVTRDTRAVLTVVFGGRSTATRNARMAELLNLGLERAPPNPLEETKLEVLRACVDAAGKPESCIGRVALRFCGATTESCLQIEREAWKDLIGRPLSMAVTEALATCELERSDGSGRALEQCKLEQLAGLQR